MKYKVRFYREFEIDTTEPEDALRMGRRAFHDSLKDIQHLVFEYEIIFKVDRGYGYLPEVKVFRSGV